MQRSKLHHPVLQLPICLHAKNARTILSQNQKCLLSTEMRGAGVDTRMNNFLYYYPEEPPHQPMTKPSPHICPSWGLRWSIGLLVTRIPTPLGDIIPKDYTRNTFGRSYPTPRRTSARASASFLFLNKFQCP